MNENEYGMAAREAGRQFRQMQANMPSSVQAAVLVVLVAASAGLVLGLTLTRTVPNEVGFGIGAVGLVLSGLIASAIQVANQWERGIVLRLGRFKGVRGPGLFLIVPVIDRVQIV